MKIAKISMALVTLSTAFLAFTNLASGQTTDSTPKKEGETVILPVFQVSERNDVGYGSNATLGGSRIVMPIDKSPGTVVTLNRTLLDDVNFIDMNDAIKFVSGSAKIANNNLNGNIAIRGYNLDNSSHRDGLPSSGVANDVMDLVDIERLEVIKGAAGVIYGAHTLGGIINRVGKRPNELRKTTFGVTAGDFALLRFELDTTGRVPATDNLLYRLVVAEQKGETQHGGLNDRTSINPTLLYNVNKNTSFFARFSYGHVKQFATGGWFVDFENKISNFMPRDWDGGVVNGAFDEMYGYQGELEYKHSFVGPFAGDWSLRVNSRYNLSNRRSDIMLRTFNFMGANGTVLGRSNQAGGRMSNPLWTGDIRIDVSDYLLIDDQTSATTSTDLAGTIHSATTKQTLLAYLDARMYRDTQGAVSYASFGSTFLSKRDHVSISSLGAGTVTPTATTGDNGFAFGLQDNLELFNSRLVLASGARYDWAGDKNSAVTNQDWSYKFGVIGRIADGISPYYAYAQTFNPVGGTTPDGKGGLLTLKNRDGTNNEVGIKFNLWGSQLTGNISYFDMSLTNIVLSEVTTNSDGTITTLRSLGGINKTSGWEADLAYQPSKKVTLLAGIGDLKSRNELGIRQRGVPEGLNYKFLGKYSFVDGLSLGLGYQHVPGRAGDRADSFSLPAFDEWNAFAYYVWKKYRFQINVENLMDSDGARTSAARTVVSGAAPRSYRLSVRYTF